MRRALCAFIGGLIVASCIVPNYEVDDSVEGGSGEGPGGESGTTSSGGSTNGGSTNGGTSGQGGGSGQGGNEEGGTSGQGGTAGQGGAPTGGTSGDAGAGTGGCAPELTDCDGECFNLQTDGEHCGDCDTECPTGEVCFEGSCELDCGTLTQCGTSCVETDTDEMHCGDCDTPCLGTCVGGDCDLSCPDGRLRCGAVCCALPPANGTVSCVSDQCQFGCASNFHGCNSDPLTCYSMTDVAYCGANCVDCRQPNATVACSPGTNLCSNTCNGEALSCTSTDGKPTCGTYDFESGTTEGWSIIQSPEGPGGSLIPTAADSALVTRTQEASTGSRSLAVHFNGDGVDRFGIEFKLRLCESGQRLDLENKVLTMDVLAVTDSGFTGFTSGQGPMYFKLYDGTNYVAGLGDFGMASDETIWVQGKLQIYPDTAPFTDIVLWFRVFTPWRGWVYIDNVRIQQCNSTLCPT